MTGMLASVNSVDEALLVLNAGVDIIDLKQAAAGALGVLDTATINAIVSTVQRRCPVSATIGDLPMQPALIFNAVQAMAETGVDYIKIGFFAEGDTVLTVQKLATLRLPHCGLIAVLFADRPIDLSFLTVLKTAGFTGVMLDTQNKQHGSLTRLMTAEQLSDFVKQAKALQLLCGLAGSLRLADIVQLMSYQADYLGFRGALCVQQDRVGQLSSAAVLAIKQAIYGLRV